MLLAGHPGEGRIKDGWRDIAPPSHKKGEMMFHLHKYELINTRQVREDVYTEVYKGGFWCHEIQYTEHSLRCSVCGKEKIKYQAVKPEAPHE